jgi:hypothetical protein
MLGPDAVMCYDAPADVTCYDANDRRVPKLALCDRPLVDCEGWDAEPLSIPCGSWGLRG